MDNMTLGDARKVLFATSLSVLLVFINSSGLAIALPTLTRDLDASTTQSIWILLIYMLATTTLILIFGRVADIMGRRRLYLLGIVVFLIASVACGLAESSEFLIAMRLVQGVGAAAIITNTTSLLTDVFPPRSLSGALGMNATVAAVGQVLGPLLGGIVTDLANWRWIFLGGVPISLIALVWSTRLIPRLAPAARHERMDYVGSALSIIGTTLLVLVVSFGGSAGWTSAPIVAGIIADAVVWVVFVMVQLHKRDPLVDFTLFADSTVVRLYLATFLCAISSFAIVLLASLFFQGVQGMKAITAGLLILPAPIGTMLAASLAGQIVRRYDPRWVSFTGLFLISSGSFALAAVLTPDSTYTGVAAALFVVGVGIGLFMTPNTSSLMSRVPAARRGIANAIRSTLQYAGYLLSTAFALAIATSGLTSLQQRAAYDGTLANMGSTDLAMFVSGIQDALVVFGLLALVGAIASVVDPRGALEWASRRRASDS